MKYPKYKETTEAEKFVYAFKQIANDTNLRKVETKYYNEWLDRIIFEDGSSIKIKDLLNYIGFNF